MNLGRDASAALNISLGALRLPSTSGVGAPRAALNIRRGRWENHTRSTGSRGARAGEGEPGSFKAKTGRHLGARAFTAPSGRPETPVDPASARDSALEASPAPNSGQRECQGRVGSRGSLGRARGGRNGSPGPSWSPSTFGRVRGSDGDNQPIFLSGVCGQGSGASRLPGVSFPRVVRRRVLFGLTESRPTPSGASRTDAPEILQIRDRVNPALSGLEVKRSEATTSLETGEGSSPSSKKEGPGRKPVLDK